MRVLIVTAFMLMATIAWGQTKSTNYQSYQNGQFLHGQTVTGTNTNNLAINTWTDSIVLKSPLYSSTGTQGAGLGFVFTPPPVLSTPPIVSSTGVINVYPNPFANEIKIELEEADNVEISLVNTLGQIEQVTQQNFGNSISLNTSLLTSGTYLLRIKTENGTALYKVVKAQ